MILPIMSLPLLDRRKRPRQTSSVASMLDLASVGGSLRRRLSRRSRKLLKVALLFYTSLSLRHAY